MTTHPKDAPSAEPSDDLIQRLRVLHGAFPDFEAGIIAGMAVAELAALREREKALREANEVLRCKVGAAETGCCYKIECAASTLNDHDMCEEANRLERLSSPTEPPEASE
jgi:hypothetical protein